MKPNKAPRASRYTPLQKVGAVAAGALLAGYAHARLEGSDPTPPKPPEHSISYLNNDPMEKGITVKEGDNGTVIAQRANGGRLYGQALLDAAQFVQNEGSGTTQGVNGEPDTHFLRSSDGSVGGQRADVVEAPIMSDQQIADVNSGKIK